MKQTLPRRSKNRPPLIAALALAVVLVTAPLIAAPADVPLDSDQSITAAVVQLDTSQQVQPLDNEVTAVALDTGQAELISTSYLNATLQITVETAASPGQLFLDTGTQAALLDVKQGLSGDSMVGISGASYATLMGEIDLRRQQPVMVSVT